MTDSPIAIGLGFLAFFALTLFLLAVGAVWCHRDARPEAVTPASLGTVPSGCNAAHPHYYRKAFADMWRCVNCGHLQPISADEVLDAAAEDFRGELPLIESYANGEASC